METRHICATDLGQVGPGRIKDTDETGFKQARACTAEGFYHDKQLKMALHCREETDPEKFLGVYVIEKGFTDLAAQLGDRPVMMETIRKLEFKYRTAINLALEKTEAGVSCEEQFEALSRVVRLLMESE